MGLASWGIETAAWGTVVCCIVAAWVVVASGTDSSSESDCTVIDTAVVAVAVGMFGRSQE